MNPSPTSHRTLPRARVSFGDCPVDKSEIGTQAFDGGTISFLTRSAPELTRYVAEYCQAQPVESAAHRVANETAKYLTVAIPFPLNRGVSLDVCLSVIFLHAAKHLREITPVGTPLPRSIWLLFAQSQRAATIALLRSNADARKRFNELCYEIPWIETDEWKRTALGALSVTRAYAECLRQRVLCLLAEPVVDAHDGIDIFLPSANLRNGAAVQIKTKRNDGSVYVAQKLVRPYHERVAIFNESYGTDFRPAYIGTSLQGGHQYFNPSNLWTPEIEEAVRRISSENSAENSRSRTRAS